MNDKHQKGLVRWLGEQGLFLYLYLKPLGLMAVALAIGTGIVRVVSGVAHNA
ncbi:MAG: hypothetical protein HZB37_03205 [Planctomycetes bacterium]|nr:hypothetical protein [Planctomycetota bacterium]